MSSSPSTGTPGRSAAPSSPSLPRLRPRFLAWAVAAFAIAAGAWFLVRLPYTRAVVWQGNRVLARFATGMDPDRIVRHEDGTFVLDTGIDRPDGTKLEKKLPDDIYAVSWNSVYFFWLVFVTPWRRLRRFWWYVALAFAVLFASQAAYFALNVGVEVAILYERNRMPFLSPGWREFFDVARRAYSLAVCHLVPFLLYTPIFFLRLRPQPAWTPAAVGGEPGRNEPCPCGSGRKYKHCCGAAR